MAPADEKKSLDYAYGWKSCKELAEGVFNRGCQEYKLLKGALCEDPNKPKQDGICDPDFSVRNADTWAITAAGIFFSENVQRAIPLNPPTSVPSGAVARAATGCTPHNDIMFDHGSGFEINSIVSFGDSFAAGMGTDPTSTDRCRVGGQNYGGLIQKHYSDKSNSLSIEKKICSGDTTSGLKEQINNWSSDDSANLALLTMGGNDLGFADIVWYCVVTPNTIQWGSTNRKKCVAAEDKARDLMNDKGENGLHHKLKTLYKGILDRGGQPDLNLFVTGYPGFFNQDTSDCDKSSFHYFWGGYKPSSDWFLDRIVYLTEDLRSELNLLVTQLNNLVEAAVNDANSEAGRGSAVHYVNIQNKFDSHRWCEQGIHEPDAKAPNTYFFLSAWNDIPLGDNDAASTESAEISTLMSTGINLPDASTCKQTQGENPDPWQNWLCLAAMGIEEEPNGPLAWSYGNATQSIKYGDVNAQEIGYWTPTRQIKTFHPRSPGMALYRDAIVEKIDALMAEW